MESGRRRATHRGKAIEMLLFTRERALYLSEFSRDFVKNPTLEALGGLGERCV